MQQAQDGRIDAQDMGQLIIFSGAPIHLISENKPARRHKEAIQELEAQLEALNDDPMAKMQLEQDIHEIQEMDLAYWCSMFREAHHFAFIWGSSANFLGCLNPWGQKSAVVQVHNMWFLFYIIYCVFQTDTVVLESSNARLLLVCWRF